MVLRWLKFHFCLAFQQETELLSWDVQDCHDLLHLKIKFRVNKINFWDKNNDVRIVINDAYCFLQVGKFFQ